MAPERLSRSCPQCGAPIGVPEGAPYVRCAHCGSASFVDLTGTLLHQALRPVVPRVQVPGRVRSRAREAGWPEAEMTGISLIYEPVWELEGARRHRVQVAARPGPEGRFAVVDLPAGERVFVEPDLHERRGDWLEPELAPEAAAEVAARSLGRPVAAASIRLLHRPVYQVRATIAGGERQVRVDAVTGELLNADWPARPTYRNRNRAWLAVGLMVAAAAAFPLPWSIPAVLVPGLVVAFWRPGAAASPRPGP